MTEHDKAMSNIKRLDDLVSVATVELQYWKDEASRLLAENATYRDLVKQLEEKQSEVRAAIWVLLEYVGINQYSD